MWMPLPKEYISEREDYSTKAKRSEAWAWIWEQRILLKKKPSQREIAKALCWSRHEVRKLQKDFEDFAVKYFTKSSPQDNQEPATKRPFASDVVEGIRKKRTKSSPKPDQKSPKTDQLSLTPAVETETPKSSKRTIKEHEHLKLLNVKTAKGIKKQDITKDVVAVYNHWHQYKPRATTLRIDQLKIIKAALKLHTVEELQRVFDYAFTASDKHPHVSWWRERKYLDITNLLNKEKVHRNVDHALDWRNGKDDNTTDEFAPKRSGLLRKRG
tara:strand:+ start:245 stop:1054 length:810 start_codon:yes stop_codon:yes gene_type:complete